MGAGGEESERRGEREEREGKREEILIAFSEGFEAPVNKVLSIEGQSVRESKLMLEQVASRFLQKSREIIQSCSCTYLTALKCSSVVRETRRYL